MKQLYESIMRSNKMFKEMNHVKTQVQQWYRVVPDACDVRKTRTQYMSVSRHTELRCFDGGTRAKEQRVSCNAATAFITQESLDAFRLVIEQLLEFYNTSVKVSVETIQYAPDSTHKAAQEEWTRIEGMIQSEFERIIQEMHAVLKAAQEVSILAERTETSALRFVLSIRQHRDLRLQPMGQSDDQHAERYNTEFED